jgi:hypothetical protein
MYGPWGIVVNQRSLSIDQPASYIPLGQGITWLSDAPDDRPSLEAGRTYGQTLSFAAAGPVRRDLVVSLRLVGYEADGFHWAWWDLDDGVPALGAIPTLKWLASSEVRDPHRLQVDPAAPAGQQTELLLRLYDAFTGRPLPILDERITDQAPWIPFGRSTIAD